jgi:hypothetical protein
MRLFDKGKHRFLRLAGVVRDNFILGLKLSRFWKREILFFRGHHDLLEMSNLFF